MLNQRIEAPVLADNVKVGARLFRSEFADVISDVKVQRIRSATGNFDIVGLCTQCLHGDDEVAWKFRLVSAYEYKHAKRMFLQ